MSYETQGWLILIEKDFYDPKKLGRKEKEGPYENKEEKKGIRREPL